MEQQSAVLAASLVEQVRLLSHPVEQPSADAEDGENAVLPDGYVRRSPVQAYYEPPEYRRRRRVIQIVSAAVGLAAAGAVVFLILRLL